MILLGSSIQHGLTVLLGVKLSPTPNLNPNLQEKSTFSQSGDFLLRVLSQPMLQHHGSFGQDTEVDNNYPSLAASLFLQAFRTILFHGTPEITALRVHQSVGRATVVDGSQNKLQLANKPT